MDEKRGDSISHIICVIYLEAALCYLRDNLPQRPREDAAMPLYTTYADDVDFTSNASQFLDEVQRIAPGCLSKWYFNISETKTVVYQHSQKKQPCWRGLAHDTQSRLSTSWRHKTWNRTA